MIEPFQTIPLLSKRNKNTSDQMMHNLGHIFISVHPLGSLCVGITALELTSRICLAGNQKKRNPFFYLKLWPITQPFQTHQGPRRPQRGRLIRFTVVCVVLGVAPQELPVCPGSLPLHPNKWRGEGLTLHTSGYSPGTNDFCLWIPTVV